MSFKTYEIEKLYSFIEPNLERIKEVPAMHQTAFRAMVVEESADHRFVRHIKNKTVSDLPEGDVLIKVHYSSLNYKDALSATGNKGVTKRFPHTPGIDAAGEVAQSASSDFQVGDAVLVTGYDLGMNTSGGFGQYIRVPAEWVVPVPPALTFKQSMVLGTAGLTAGLSLLKLEQAGILPETGPILVTGASGGVGSLAVAMLAGSGYSAVAASGKSEARELLMDLGAKEILGREAVMDKTAKPLLPARFAGVIDTVGGDILSFAIRSTQYGGTIASCGNAASGDLPLTVYPFILRGVTLTGIDSAGCPMSIRRMVWQRLAGDWKIAHMDRITTEIGLEDLNARIDTMLAGGNVGRCIVDLGR
jgi:acrylyl-CoA reductase (NADPH)